MSSLKGICEGIPVDPLPRPRGRDEYIPHAPVRTPELSLDEQRVSVNISSLLPALPALMMLPQPPPPKSPSLPS